MVTVNAAITLLQKDAMFQKQRPPARPVSASKMKLTVNAILKLLYANQALPKPVPLLT